MNLGNQPVEILVEDVYLLVVPSPQTSTNPEEDEARTQAAKAERLENAELLHVRGQTEGQSGERCLSDLNPSFFNSLDSSRVNTNARTCAVPHRQGYQQCPSNNQEHPC
jgi:vacuolar protein sorting-associated protein 13A/C